MLKYRIWKIGYKSVSISIQNLFPSQILYFTLE